MELNEQALQIVEESDVLVDECQACIVKSDEDYAVAADYLKAIKSKSKELDAQRKDMTRPIDKTKKDIIALFKPVLDRLSQGEKIVKKGIADYMTIKEKAIEEAKKENPGMMIINDKPKDGISSREVWDCKIVDEALIPREYLVVDVQKLKAKVRAEKETAKVPGVKFYSYKQVVARS